MTETGLIIQVGLPEARRDEAARLYLEAFDAKLGPVLGRGDRARRFLNANFRPSQAIFAETDARRLAGVLGFHDENGGLVGGDMRSFRRAYGVFGGLLRGFALSLFERSPAPQELMLDGIVVAPEHRGEGVGSRLLQAAEKYALERGFGRIRLDVVDTNPDARRLYTRHGYIAEETSRHPIIGRAFGFTASTTMRKAVTGDTGAR